MINNVYLGVKMQSNIVHTQVTKESQKIANSMPYQTVLKSGIKIQSPTPMVFKRGFGNVFMKTGYIIPPGSVVTLPNGKMFKTVLMGMFCNFYGAGNSQYHCWWYT